MLPSFARYAPSIVAGSALAGFGLSFGRDVYKKAKKNWPILLVFACLVGVYFSGLWLFRNYRTPFDTIIKRTGAILALIVSSVGVYVGAAFIAVTFLPVMAFVPTDTVDSLTFDPMILLDFPLLWIFIAQIGLFVMGAVMGIRHRERRRLAWEAEEHNEHFLDYHGLEVIDVDEKGNLRLRDHNENIGYRLMDDLEVTGELEFMALGKRNKRGYIHYDSTGKYTHWSGLAEVH